MDPKLKINKRKKLSLNNGIWKENLIKKQTFEKNGMKIQLKLASQFNYNTHQSKQSSRENLQRIKIENLQRNRQENHQRNKS